MDLLQAVYAEQTTPDEVVVFLLLGTAATLLIAFVCYGLVLLLLSRIRMREGLTFWQLLLPSWGRMRKYAAEYTLGILTAVLLGLTVVMKHTTVEMILEEDMSSVAHATVLEALQGGQVTREDLIDKGASPENADLILKWLADGTIEQGLLDVESIIRPLLTSGMSESANLIVRSVIDLVEPNANLEYLRVTLVVASIVLLLGYVLWFSTQRWRDMQREQAGEPAYATIMKRLALPAVCIPLLFVSAVALEDAERLVDSAIASAVASEPERPERPERLSTAIVEATSESRVDPSDLDELNEALTNLSGQIGDVRRSVIDLERSVADTTGALNDNLTNVSDLLDTHMIESGERFDGLQGQIDSLRGDLAELESLSDSTDQIEALARRAIEIARETDRRLTGNHDRLRSDVDRLLAGMRGQHDCPAFVHVLNSASPEGYRIFPAGSRQVVASGGVVGMHVLPPGRYTISVPGAESRTVTLASCTAENVTFEARAPQLQMFEGRLVQPLEFEVQMPEREPERPD